MPSVGFTAGCVEEHPCKIRLQRIKGRQGTSFTAGGLIMTATFADYLTELRERVCSRCSERVPRDLPCDTYGKRCGIEINLPWLVCSIHHRAGATLDLHVQSFHEDLCVDCAFRDTGRCPCPLAGLLQFAVEAIKAVDERRKSSNAPT
jgi:hypothetical protein